MLNEWSLGQIWDNLIIVQGRTTFEDEKVAAGCETGEALIEDSRGIEEVHANLVKRAQVDGWHIPTIDYDKREVVSQRPFNRLDANKVPVYIVNAYMANKCWDSPKEGMEKCWKLPQTDRSGNFLNLAEYCIDSSSSACFETSSTSDGVSSAYSDSGSSESFDGPTSDPPTCDGVCSTDYAFGDCAYGKELKYIFIDEARKLVDKMKEMKTRPMFPSWTIYETDLKNDIRKFNSLQSTFNLTNGTSGGKFTITDFLYYGVTFVLILTTLNWNSSTM